MIPSTLTFGVARVGATRFDTAGLRGEGPPSLAGGIDDSLAVVMQPVREEALLEVEPHALDGINGGRENRRGKRALMVSPKSATGVGVSTGG